VIVCNNHDTVYNMYSVIGDYVHVPLYLVKSFKSANIVHSPASPSLPARPTFSQSVGGDGI
jgi:hypothetical protein